MIFYRAAIKRTHKHEIFASVDLKHVREYAERYASYILNGASHSNGCYFVRLPSNRVRVFQNDTIVQVTIEKVESKDLVEYKTLFEYAPGLWSTASIL